MKVPILKGPRIVLRPLKVSDASNYVRWFRDKEVVQYFNQYVWRITLEKEKSAIRKLQRNKKEPTWAIEVEGRHIGGTGIVLNVEDKTGSWGIVIGEKDEWGKGYAGEIINLCAKYFFEKLKGERFELQVEMENKRAIKAYEKAGFKFDGVLRSIKYSKVLKRRIDNGVMSILRDEWSKNIK